MAGARVERGAWRALAPGVAGSAVVLAAALLLLSQVGAPLGARTICDDAAPAGPPDQCAVEQASAAWWVAYALLFPAAWRALGFLGLGWLGAACLGLVGSGLAVLGLLPSVAPALLLAAAAGSAGVLVAVRAVVQDTAPTDAPLQVALAGVGAGVGVGLLALAAWQARHSASLPRRTSLPSRAEPSSIDRVRHL